MRLTLVPLLLATVAAPALAAPAPATNAAPVRAAPPAPVAAPDAVPAELFDERTIDQVTRMVGAMTKAFLDLPVGNIEAAMENRPATRADRARTVRSVTGTSEAELGQDLEASKGAMKAGGQAIARSLPAIREALNKAGEEIERATANLPQPGYPRR